jgi:pyruvate formate-lyase activating enzyme-like uncharacterized protein
MASVEGSGETAMSVIWWASQMGMEMPIHYCPSSVKDAIQTRMRLIRRGKNVARPYDMMDEEGVLSKLTVDTGRGGNHSKVDAKLLAQRIGVPNWAVGVHPSGEYLEASLCMGDEVIKAAPQAKLCVVKEYPTTQRERFRVFSS